MLTNFVFKNVHHFDNLYLLGTSIPSEKGGRNGSVIFLSDWKIDISSVWKHPL